MDIQVFEEAMRTGLALAEKPAANAARLVTEGSRRGMARPQLAQVLATAYWETARTMEPVREAYYLGSFEAAEDWRKRNLSYYPYYGRGYVQLTHKANYQRASQFFGADFVAEPDLALDERYALPILFQGMEDGWFAGKKLDDEIDAAEETGSEDLREFRNARRIVTGTDKAATVTLIAAKMEAALVAAGYGEATPAAPVAGKDFAAMIQALGLKHFKPYEFLVKGDDNGNPDSPAFGLNTDPPRAKWGNIAETARLIDALRSELDLPIVLTSVYRSPAYNRAVGGVRGSQHVEFRAVDFIVRGSPVGPVEWAHLLKDWRSAGRFRGGIGVYKGFVHVDTRGVNVDF